MHNVRTRCLECAGFKAPAVIWHWHLVKLLFAVWQELLALMEICCVCMQAAVHPEVLDELRRRLSTQLECFASPLNCRWPSYCSMFPDTDAPFGSRGDFFQFCPTGGSFEANPPFDRAFVSSMAIHMQNLLLQTEVRLIFGSRLHVVLRPPRIFLSGYPSYAAELCADTKRW